MALDDDAIDASYYLHNRYTNDDVMAVDYWTNWLNGVGIIEDDVVENGEMSLSHLIDFLVFLCVVNFSFFFEMECEEVTTQTSRLCSLLYISRYIQFPFSNKNQV